MQTIHLFLILLAIKF